MSEIKLKNCPFCGGKAKIIEIGRSGSMIQARCTVCGASSKMVTLSAEYAAADKVVNNWNQRVSGFLKASWTEQTFVTHIGETNIPISKCSHCGFTLCDILNRTDLYHYCPSCGARMSEEVQP